MTYPFSRRVDRLDVNISANRQELGSTAAEAIADGIRRVLRDRDDVRILFASAASQRETLAALVAEPDIEWERVTAFHLDEYVGIDEMHPASFRRFLHDNLFSRVRVKEFHGIQAAALRPEEEMARYADLLASREPDIALLGIGENGHLAFNDPPVADFEDPLRIKVVRLDEVCRQQQVNDGAFARLEQVPTHAFTLTIPQIFRTPRLYVMVPGPTKSQAVRATLQDAISTACPATILRRHPLPNLFLDADSAALLGW